LPTPRQIKLATIDDCRREMASLYRETKAGKRDTSEGSKLAYILSQIAKLIEVGELEKRMVAIEARLSGTPALAHRSSNDES
jgi:hypothetical protein